MEKKMIETERLILREMTEQDFDALFAVLGDPEVMQLSECF
jgi:RimJ/RimL family protein N-acetyltransferase